MGWIWGMERTGEKDKKKWRHSGEIEVVRG